MSERAYSLELSKNISAKEAVELSKNGCLEDERAFRCCDEKCHISLTCTNWKNTSGKRFYFVPSCKDELHVIGCDEVGKKEKYQQIEKEVRDIVNEVRNNGVITMMISPDRNTKKVTDTYNEKKTSSKGNKNLYRKNDYRGIKYEGRRAARIEAFIEIFNNNRIDKNSEVIYVNEKRYSLNELFVSSNILPYDNIFGIFYGEAVINTCSFNKNMIEIKYLNSFLPPIYTNIGSLKKIGNGTMVKKFIDTNEGVKTYFRGFYKKKNNKFISYNDKFFKDLYFEE